jgi:hypothetical protein
MKKLSFIFLVLVLSCKYEESTNTKSFIANNTSHSIIIAPYYQGGVVKSDSISINSNQQYMILDKNNKGKGTGFSYSSYIAIYDSIQIIFDNSVKSTHYSYASNTLGTNPKAITYDSSRSIYNEANYVRNIIMESKRSISNEYTFTFTEQDYLDANQ